MNKIHNWTVIGEKKLIKGKQHILCKCVCGKERYVRELYLKEEKSKSCGCVRKNPYKDLKTRFFDKFEKTKNCWVWKGAISSGYGVIRNNYKSEKAYRVSWILHNGEIPYGMCVCHSCDNPICVNPEHLFLGTHKDNMHDMFNKNRRKHAKGESVYLSKLTENQVLEIRSRYKTKKVTMKNLSNEFHISYSAIKNIIGGRTWKHI